MKTFLVLLCGLFLLSAVALAADVSGKWTGTFSRINSDGGSNEDTAYLDLKQEGSQISGTVGPNLDKQFPIIKGQIEGQKITLDVKAQIGGQETTVKFELTLAEDRLQGEATAQKDGETIRAKLDVRRKID